MAAIVVGLGLCFAGQPQPTVTTPNPSLGNLLGMAAGVAWAATLMGLRAVQRERSDAAPDAGLSTVVVGNAIACVGALPFAWPIPSAPTGEWLTLVYLGAIQIALAYVCLSAAIRHLPALEASLLLLLEPVLNPLWTWIVRGEEPGPWALLGGTVIVVATAFKVWVDSDER
jgi:drug/metabolite transporter (DMT)-like permease